MNDSAEGRRITEEIISWSISTTVWDRAGIRFWYLTVLISNLKKKSSKAFNLVQNGNFIYLNPILAAIFMP